MKSVRPPPAGCVAQGQLLHPSAAVHPGSQLPYTLGGRLVLVSRKCAPIASPHGPGAASLHSRVRGPRLAGPGAPEPARAAQPLRCEIPRRRAGRAGGCGCWCGGSAVMLLLKFLAHVCQDLGNPETKIKGKNVAPFVTWGILIENVDVQDFRADDWLAGFSLGAVAFPAPLPPHMEFLIVLPSFLLAWENVGNVGAGGVVGAHAQSSPAVVCGSAARHLPLQLRQRQRCPFEG